MSLLFGMMLATLTLLAAAQGGGVEPHPDAAPPAGLAPPDADDITTVDALLDALERADRDIRTLQGELVYDRIMGLQGDLHRRFGTLYFEAAPTASDAPMRRRFAVRFDSLQIGQRIEDERIDLIFDGRWLIEKDYEHKPRPLLTRREVAPEGATFDPMRLGEGPVPLPLGQRKADILAHFDASMPDAAEGLEEMPSYLRRVQAGPGSYQLLLIPHEGDEAREKFNEVRLWYEKGTMHPRLARTLTRAGDTAFVMLGEVDVNAPLPDGALDPGPPEEGWDVQTVEGQFNAPANQPGLDAGTLVLPPEGGEPPDADDHSAGGDAEEGS